MSSLRGVSPVSAVIAGAVSVVAAVAAYSYYGSGRMGIRGSHAGDSALQCDQSEYDFGSLDSTQCESLRHVFALHNTSDRPIHVLRCLTSCGCTTVALDATAVEPNGVLELPVNANWRDRDGSQSAQILLQTDESGRSGLVLKLRGYVANPLGVWPRQLDFGDVDPGPTDERVFEITLTRNRDAFSIHSLTPSDPSVVVRRLSGDASNPTVVARFAVRVVAPRSAGFQRHAIRVDTSSGEKPILIPITLSSRGAITVMPQSILLSATGRDNADEAGWPSATELSVHVVGATLESRFDASVRPVSGNPLLQIELGKAKADRGGITTTVVIRSVRGTPGRAMANVHLQCGEDAHDVPVVIVGDIQENERASLTR